MMASDDSQNAHVTFNPSSLQSLSLEAVIEHRIEELMKLPHYTFIKLYQGGHSRSLDQDTLRMKFLTKAVELIIKLSAQL